MTDQLPPESWTRRESDFPAEKRVHTIFEAIAADRPDAIAVVVEETQLSYRELNERANRLAHHLIRLGAQPGGRIGVVVERSLDLLVIYLGILKAGGAYVPIEASFPADRIAFTLEDAAVQLAVTQQHLAEKVFPVNADVVCIDRDWKDIAQNPTDNPAVPGKSTDAAYVIYTSGSTGRPKGVIIPHRGLIRLVTNQDYFPFGPNQCHLLAVSPGFDAAMVDTWGAILNGGRCSIFPDRWPEFGRLEQVIRATGVTAVLITPALFNQIVDFQPSVLATVKHLQVGGEAMSVPHLLRARKLLADTTIYNVYGPTECSVVACAYRVGDPREWGCSSVPIGLAISNTECYIVDDALRPVPIGEPGELIIGGPGVSLGYLNRPELTAEKFVRNPFSDSPDDRVYRSGDQCRWLPNGLIEFLGRADEQIKLHGFRIELGEIEQQLKLCDGVLDAAAIAYDPPSGIRQIVAFLVPARDQACDSELIRRALTERLPRPMVPSAYLLVDALPINHNGKLDRKELKLMATRSLPAVASMRTRGEPTSPLEKSLLEIWRNVLGQPEIGIHDNFFQCGGDSLSAIDLAFRVQAATGRTLPVGVVHRASTPSALARWFEAGSSALEKPARYELRGSGDGPPFFFIPGVSGYAKLPPALARRLTGICPYFDELVFPGVDGKTAPLQSLEEVAAELIRQIRQIRPHGPYFICGYSLAGLVAFEVAWQLSAQGETVERLILWDADFKTEYIRRTLLGSVHELRRWLKETPIREIFAQPCRKIWYRAELICPKFMKHLGFFAKFTSPGRPTDPLESLLWDANLAAEERYHPKPYQRRIDLVFCTVQPLRLFHSRPPNNGWDEFARGGLVVHRVPHAHLDLLHAGPALEEVAEITASIISKAVKSSPRRTQISRLPGDEISIRVGSSDNVSLPSR